MIHIGIDPGKSGGIASMAGFSILNPLTIKLSETPSDVVEWLWSTVGIGSCPARAIIEQVHATPQMGVTSAFSFGRSYGWLLGVLDALRIPYEFVSPQKWQKALGCLSKGDKNATKAAAQRLWPNLRITHAIADALLLAEYGRRLEVRQ